MNHKALLLAALLLLAFITAYAARPAQTDFVNMGITTKGYQIYLDILNVTRKGNLIGYWSAIGAPFGQSIQNISINCATGQFVFVESHSYDHDNIEFEATQWPTGGKIESIPPGSVIYGIKNMLCSAPWPQPQPVPRGYHAPRNLMVDM